MTYQEALRKEKRWARRAIIINLCHKSMQLRRKKWSMRLTAKKLSISLGAVSEGIKLANALLDDSSLEFLCREDALKKIR